MSTTKLILLVKMFKQPKYPREESGKINYGIATLGTTMHTLKILSINI